MNLSRLFARFASPFTSKNHIRRRKLRQKQRKSWSAEILETRVMLSASGISIDGNFSDWDDVTSYTDPADDQHDTDHNQQTDTPAYVDHPDVDLLEYKVTHDEENFYFYFRATGEIGATQQEDLGQNLRAGRYYVIVTIDVDNDDTTGYWLHEGGYFPTTDGYDMNAELEFYNGSINTGHYLLHAALNDSELEQDFADQSSGDYVWGGDQTQGPFDPGFVELKSGDYDHYTQWVYKENDPDNGGDDSVTFVQDKGPVVTGIIDFAQSVDGTELEMIVPFKGFLVDQFGNSIIELGKTVDLSFSLEASGELSNEVSTGSPNGEWASDTADPINGYVLTTPKDYGDAPDSYATLEASGGPSHLSSSLYLGTGVDTELDGLPDVTAALDTLDDGITSISALTAGEAVTGTFTSSGTGFLNGWIDYNQDGDFDDEGEQFVVDQAVVAGTNNLNFNIPLSATTGQTYARFRLSSQSGLSYGGEAPDGEVEDYYIIIEGAAADLAISKSSTPESVAQGENISYTLTVTNNGPSAVTGATVTDTFNDELENVTWTAVLSSGATGSTSGSGNINELIDLANGATITYTVSGKVKSDAKSFVLNKATVTAPALVTDADLTNNSDYDIDLITVATSISLGEFVSGDIAPGVNAGDFVKEVAFGDLDGDGDDDAVFAFVDGGHQIWFYDENSKILVNSGQALAIEPNPAGAHHALGTEIADFNNDGYLDILVLVKSTQAVYLNDGSGNFSEPGIDITGISSLESYEVELGDLDGDGDMDIVVADDDGSSFGGTGNSLLLFNDGTGAFTQITSMPMTTSDDDTWDTTVGDFDGDGSLDLVFANFSSGQSSEIWFNDGTGSFTKDTENFGGKLHWNVEKGDFDDDGDLDLMLVVNNSDPDYVELWNNDGAGNFTYSGQRTFTTENGQGGIEGIQIGDLDGDGDLDAFFSTFGVVGTIQTWENDGFGNFSTGFVSSFITPTSPETAGGWRARLGDVDGDGDLDAFVFEGLNEQMHYFENISNYAPTVGVDNSSVTVDEGQTANNTGTYNDADGDDVTLTASVGTVTDNNDGTWSWAWNTSDGPDDTQTVTITATDSDGASSQVTFDLTVNNVAPTLTVARSSFTVDEDVRAINYGTYGDSNDDTVTLTASFGNIIDNNDGTWSWYYDSTDGPDESQTVTITATDSDGFQTQKTFNMTVNNVAPEVRRAHSNVFVPEGETATNRGTYNDPGNDTVTLSASIGTITDNNDGTWTWSYDAPLGGAVHTVYITATDSDGLQGQSAFTLYVNEYPTIDVDNATVTVDEGETATNSGTFTEHTGSFNLSASIGIISIDSYGVWSWSYDTTDGPDESGMITVTIVDEVNLEVEVSFTLTVNNVAPSVGVDNASVNVTEGETAINSGTYDDPGNDTVTVTASVGSITDNNDGVWSWSFGTSDPGESQTVTITATDSDGAQTQTTFGLTVSEESDTTPTVSTDNSSVTVNEGDIAINSGTYTDETGNPWITASIGTITDNNDGTWSWSLDTTDGPDESATVTVSIVDENNNSKEVTFDLIVNNVAPSVGVDNASVSVTEGETAVNSGTYDDDGDDTVTVSASVGSVTDNNDGTWSWSFGTSDPSESQTVTITATDSDGAQTQTTFVLTVNEDNNSAPVADAGGPYLVQAEETTLLDGSASTDAEQDSATLTYEWDLDGDGIFGETGAAAIYGDETGVTPVFDASSVTSNQTFDIDLKVTDAGGKSHISSSTVEVITTSPDFGFAIQYSGENDGGYGNSIVTDASGNVYTVGVFTGTVDFDGGSGTFELTSAGMEDGFITKVDSLGNFVWAKRIGGIGLDEILSATLDAQGNLLLTGEFEETVDFDPGTGVSNITSSNANNSFILKLDTDGNYLWAKNLEGIGTNQARDITTDLTGNVYIAGRFHETVDFDPGIGTYNLVSNGSYDAFVLKLYSNGGFVWAKSFGSTDRDIIYGITVDSNGNVYTTGNYEGTVDFDPGTGSYNLTSNGEDDIFISKLDSSGNFVWARGVGGDKSDKSFEIALDESGNVLATGRFEETVDFDPGTGVSNLTSHGDDDIFVLKIDSAGNYVWAQSMGGSGGDSAYDIDVDATGAVYLTGDFELTADFDPGANVANLTSNGEVDVFVTKLDSTGAFVWAESFGGEYYELGEGIAVDLNGNVYTTGAFNETVDFNPGPGTYNLTVQYTEEVFVSKLIQNYPPLVSVDNSTVSVNEGQAANNTGTHSDPENEAITLTASVGTVTDNNDGTWSWAWNTSDGPDDTQTVTITATDSEGAQTQTTFDLTVDNVAPSVGVDNASVTVDQGLVATNSGTLSDAGDDTVILTASRGTVTDNNDGTWSWSYDTNGTYPSNSPRLVTITATDSDGEASQVSFNVIATNVPPSLSVDATSVSVNEGETATMTGTFSETDDSEVWLTASIGSVSESSPGVWSWSYDSTDGPDDSQTVTIYASDELGEEAEVTFTLTVNNVAPSVGVDNASVSVTEGETANNSGTYDDDGDDTVTVTASVGSITDNNDGTWSWSFGTSDPSESQTVTITATDSDGAQTQTTFELTVSEEVNTAPSVNTDSSTVAVNEGQTANNTGTYNDVDGHDVTLTASAGTVIDNNDGTWSWAWNTSDGPDESQTVMITATDSEGASNQVTFDLTVNNVAPSVTADNTTVTVNEGDTANNTGTYGDPGDDTVTVTASIGTLIDNNDGTWSWSFDTTGQAAGPQTVTIFAVDSDGATTQISFSLNIEAGSFVLPIIIDFEDQSMEDFNYDSETDWNVLQNNGSYQLKADSRESEFGMAVFGVNEPLPNMMRIAADIITLNESGRPQKNGYLIFDYKNDNDFKYAGMDVDFNTWVIGHFQGNWNNHYTSVSTPISGGQNYNVELVFVDNLVILNVNGSQMLYTTIAGLSGLTSGGVGMANAEAVTTFDNFTIDYSNGVPPTVFADNSTVTVNEGETATNTGTFIDLEGESITLSASAGAVIDNNDGTWSWSLETLDPSDTQTVIITATDSDGEQGSVTFELEVLSIEPPSDLYPILKDFNDPVSWLFDFQYNPEAYWGLTYHNNSTGLQVDSLDSSLGDDLGIAILNLDQELPSSVRISSEITTLKASGRSDKNGFIVFDYKNDFDFKYAGMSKKQNQWIIGHYQGDWNNQIAMVDWDDQGRKIKNNRVYHVDVILQGNDVDLIVDGEAVLSGTFDGVSALNQNKIGLANHDGITIFDNFEVAIYEEPVPFTPYETDFETGQPDDFNPLNPAQWNVVNGELIADTSNSQGDGITLVELDGFLTDPYEISADITAVSGQGQSKNGFIIFDYKNANDFKFAGMYAGSNKWVIGEFNGSWRNRMTVDWDFSGHDILNNQSYNLLVHLEGNTATLTIDGELIGSHAFADSAVLTFGQVGLANKNGITRFDNFKVASEIIPSAAAIDSLFAEEETLLF